MTANRRGTLSNKIVSFVLTSDPLLWVTPPSSLSFFRAPATTSIRQRQLHNKKPDFLVTNCIAGMQFQAARQLLAPKRRRAGASRAISSLLMFRKAALGSPSGNWPSETIVHSALPSLKRRRGNARGPPSGLLLEELASLRDELRHVFAGAIASGRAETGLVCSHRRVECKPSKRPNQNRNWRNGPMTTSYLAMSASPPRQQSHRAPCVAELNVKTSELTPNCNSAETSRSRSRAFGECRAIGV
jgi:hypothetical protein